ncbi:hypothetical protein P171DRAFT_480892 [Karstenula rhodostoma CBS 690.94]|uniref:Uncharacterized protein n=1 Tax=Karstenula rhodostoma CBS 690.94 TaxID=1392251 RepID=A0A9P4PV21_9PLEO|nr:hypothetical protein P171DRAFT_480892 [Karstenula rhodostoma CBS 690.94]
MSSNNAVVAPAPVLKFPIQLKPSGKAVSGAKEQPKPSPQKDQAESKPAAQKQDLATIHEWAMSLNVNTRDLRELSREERLALLDGPTAPLIAGDKVIGAAPLRLIIAASSTARNEFITTNKIPSTTLMKFNCYYLKTSTFTHDIDLILAAESTDLDTYIRNIRNFWWAYLKTKPVAEIGYQKLKDLETRTVSGTENFAMTKMLVKRLAQLWYHYEIANIFDFDSWMETLPKMLKAMNEHIDQWDALRAQRKMVAEQKQEQAKKDAFAEQLLVARGGRAGGYGMGI